METILFFGCKIRKSDTVFPNIVSALRFQKSFNVIFLSWSKVQRIWFETLHAHLQLQLTGIRIVLKHHKGVGHGMLWLCSALLAAWLTTSTSFRGEREVKFLKLLVVLINCKCMVIFLLIH